MTSNVTPLIQQILQSYFIAKNCYDTLAKNVRIELKAVTLSSYKLKLGLKLYKWCHNILLRLTDFDEKENEISLSF